MNNFNFEPTDGLRDKNYFATRPANEEEARAILQTPLDQLRDFINQTIVNFFNSGGEIGGAVTTPNGYQSRGSIGSGIDLNTVIKNGVYQIIPGTLNNNGVSYGILTVDISGGYIKQTLTNVGSGAWTTYFRESGNSGTSWKDWTGLGENINSTAQNGYKNVGDGVIVQWGSTTVGHNAMVTQNFPISFPNNALSVTANIHGTTLNTNTMGAMVNINSKSQISIGQCSGVSQTVKWIAIGY